VATWAVTVAEQKLQDSIEHRDTGAVFRRRAGVAGTNGGGMEKP